MASFTLQIPEGLMAPNGSVQVYAGPVFQRGRPPQGTLVTTATAADSVVSFTGLEPDASYHAYQLVGSDHVYLPFSTFDTASDGADAGETIKHAVIDASSSGNNLVIAAVTDARIMVVQYTLLADADVTARWRSASTNISGPLYLGAKGGAAPKGDVTVPLLATVAGEALNLNLGSAVNVGGHLTYYEETSD